MISTPNVWIEDVPWNVLLGHSAKARDSLSHFVFPLGTILSFQMNVPKSPHKNVKLSIMGLDVSKKNNFVVFVGILNFRIIMTFVF